MPVGVPRPPPRLVASRSRSRFTLVLVQGEAAPRFNVDTPFASADVCCRVALQLAFPCGGEGMSPAPRPQSSPFPSGAYASSSSPVAMVQEEEEEEEEGGRGCAAELTWSLNPFNSPEDIFARCNAEAKKVSKNAFPLSFTSSFCGPDCVWGGEQWLSAIFVRLCSGGKKDDGEKNNYNSLSILFHFFFFSFFFFFLRRLNFNFLC